MRRRTLFRISQHLPATWQPISPGLPRHPHPLPIQIVHVAQWFHALSDITRLYILEFLSTCDRSVTELATLTGAPQSSVSFHLKVLKEAGLVAEHRALPWKYFSLRRESWEYMIGFIQRIGPEAHRDCLLTCCQKGLDVSRKVDTFPP